MKDFPKYIHAMFGDFFIRRNLKLSNIAHHEMDDPVIRLSISAFPSKNLRCRAEKSKAEKLL